MKNRGKIYYLSQKISLWLSVVQTAVRVALEQWFSALTPLTHFEIRVPCEAQNRGARPWLAPVTWQTALLTTTGGRLSILQKKGKKNKDLPQVFIFARDF
ncbi:hypothetical protein [Companilactobacillus heilongjiangensis]|uniref:Uncharacterized protein n=1 Tax=Companilactobacillus heilongjiangensis TaxID=1074467 RepID=A0A0K2LEC0_9LACO|nr:hypothetical protein [Companilactobacillus heilongjiangensis]ALB29637.1 hypothetical protein JP39_09875 [Companilactobacillus heilongjiangensis]